MKKSSWLQRQQAHFDSKSREYSRMYGQHTPFHDAMTRRLLELAGVKGGMKVLDMGCGAGRTTIPLLQAGCHVTGLELSASTLELLQQKISTLNLQESFTAEHGAAEDLDSVRDYDLIMGRGILHHLQDPQAVIERVHRALRPGGKAVFMDPNPMQAAWLAFITLHPALSWQIESGVLRHTPWKNRRLFRKAGFAEIHMSFLGLVPPPLWTFRQFSSNAEEFLEHMPGINRLGLYMLTIAHIRQ